MEPGACSLGSCSMKYNPKISEAAAALPGFQRAHPHQPDHTVQGSLELMWRLEQALCEITGMTRATLQPPAGACGELTGLLIMRAHHSKSGNPRRRVVIPDSAHGTNPASVRLSGYMGFDIVHINTHKTFATPHGGGGPGAGPVGVTEALVPFLPVPRVERREDGSYGLETDDPDSIGRMHGFLGNFAILVRAYAYVFLHGREGLQEVAERAVLNANYLAHLVKDAFPLEYPDMPPMHEFVSSARALKEETGIRAMDVAKRVIDLGYHPSTVYFPIVVEEALMVEPTETETRETLDAFAGALLRAHPEAHEDPDLLHEAPVPAPARAL